MHETSMVEPATESAPPIEPGTEQGVIAAEVAPALALAREALIAAHPDSVPELIGGATVEELRASVAAAREAYARVVEAVQSRPSAVVSPAVVTRSQPLDLAALSPSAKIAMGLRQRDSAGWGP